MCFIVCKLDFERRRSATGGPGPNSRSVFDDINFGPVRNIDDGQIISKISSEDMDRYSNAVALPSKPTNINTVFEMAAEMVAKKLEQKLMGPGVGAMMSSVPAAMTFPANNLMFGGGGINFGSSASVSTELLTGLVTQMQENFGMISGEVFFLFK